MTDDSGNRHQLELLLHHFGCSAHVASGRNVDNQQDSADSHGVESNGVNIPITMNQQDGHDFQSEPSGFLDLTAAFLHLSTSNDPAPLVPRAPPGFPPYSLTFQPSLNAKYYVIVKGKCTGIYYGNWYAYIFLWIQQHLINNSLRDDVRCLTDHVPGARYKSFKTLEQATAFYLDAKHSRKVGYVCNPGDVVKFGPDEAAVQ